MPAAPDLAEQALALALPLILRFEGLRLRPYLCSAGVPTIGIGSTRYADGRPVRLTDPPITPEQASALAHAQIGADYLPAVLQLCPGLDTPRRIAAITSWATTSAPGRCEPARCAAASTRRIGLAHGLSVSSGTALPAGRCVG